MKNKNSIDYFAFIQEHAISDDLDNRCLARDLQEQGIRAVHKLIDDPDPAWDTDVDLRVGKGGRNSKDYAYNSKIPEDYRKKWYED
jgi:hypothetical protein